MWRIRKLDSVCQYCQLMQGKYLYTSSFITFLLHPIYCTCKISCHKLGLLENCANYSAECSCLLKYTIMTTWRKCINFINSVKWDKLIPQKLLVKSVKASLLQICIHFMEKYTLICLIWAHIVYMLQRLEKHPNIDHAISMHIPPNVQTAFAWTLYDADIPYHYS